jgi:hypothetical protein
MRDRHQLDQALFTGSRQSRHVAVEHGLEWLFGLPTRVLRRQLPDAVENEGELDIHRLLDPQRAVIVESRDTLIFGHEIRPAGDSRNKVGDRTLRRAVIPGWQPVAAPLCLHWREARRCGQNGKCAQRRKHQATTKL